MSKPPRMEKSKDAATPRTQRRNKLKATLGAEIGIGSNNSSSHSRRSSKSKSKDSSSKTKSSKEGGDEKKESKKVDKAAAATAAKEEAEAEYDPLEHIPEEYRKHGVDTEPILHYIREKNDEEDLDALLEAAQSDVRLHQARIRAAAANDTALLRSYNFMLDPMYLSRQERKIGRVEVVELLTKEARTILRELDEDKKNLTPEERTQVKLARWQRALELYVYCPSEMSLDLLGLLEKLLDGTNEEQELSDVLSQASQMCSSLVDSTHVAVRDATEDAAQAEDAYMIRLEAHQMFANTALRKSEEIQSQFKTNGRAALQIGHQLEFAESKRAQCESASILIRRWWMMEQLAESEDISGEELKVNEEVRGIIPPASCRMDPLFTLPEQSLEASKALKQLRAVVKSRGNAATAAATASGGWSDPNSARRFDLTANLIRRTSSALEQRLLNSFAQIYSTGGSYDFSDTPRKGSINWVHLRELAQALLMFDSGRNLHKTYVNMVITSRFPELFQAKKKPQLDSDDEDSDEDMDFDMDATRSELSSLFYRVSEVCTAEFELIAHVFGQSGGNDEMTLTVARALLQRVISDPKNGLQSRISDLLESIDRRGDFDAGSKKLDTFVVIHEKAAGLFCLLRDAAEKMIAHSITDGKQDAVSDYEAAVSAITALKQFLTSQEIALSSGHRKGYLNLELRLLHHNCCDILVKCECQLDRPKIQKQDFSLADKGILEEYNAPVLPINFKFLLSCDILSGPLKSSVLRQPLICATDSLARARLMFGDGKKGGETTARVIASIYTQMCNFYGPSYLYPIVQALGEKLNPIAPNSPPQLPFDENAPAHDLGVASHFWVALEYIHTAAKSFDRELWAENRPGSGRVWEILQNTGGHSSMGMARKCRLQFYAELESRGETAIHKALQTLSEHIRWILVSGGESMFATGGNRFFSGGGSGGPYAIPHGSSLDTPNSPAVKSLTYCLRSQFVNIQAALTPQSLSAFWSALSVRLYDVFVPRIVQHYTITQVGAVILSRDVEALRSVSMLAGANHPHWENLREAVTLYMTPPGALKSMLVGPEGDLNSTKGLMHRVGRYQALVFMSRRADYKVKTGQGPRKATWVVELLEDLGIPDPADGHINMGQFAAEKKFQN